MITPQDQITKKAIKRFYAAYLGQIPRAIVDMSDIRTNTLPHLYLIEENRVYKETQRSKRTKNAC